MFALRFRWLTAVVACLALASAARADLLLHSTMDDANVHRAGTYPPPALSTVGGPFTVEDLAGTAQDGLAKDILNNTATASNHVVSSATGKMAQALSFDPTGVASNRGVTYGDVHDIGTGNFTASVWFNAVDTDATQTIAGKGNASSADVGWNFFLENDTLFARVGGGGTTNRASQRLSFNDANENTWFNVILSVDNLNGTVTGRLNGASAGWVNGGGGPSGNTFTAGTNINTAGALVAGINSNGANEFKGLIDDFALWNELLTEGELKSIYNLANESALNYNASQAQALWDVFESGTIDNVGGRDWYRVGNGSLSGSPGQVLNLGNGQFALVLDSAGNGVAMTPEPASIFLWLVGGILGFIAWRCRRSSNRAAALVA